MRTAARTAAVVAALSLISAACGGGSESADAGDGDEVITGELVDQSGIELDADAVTTTTEANTADAGGGAAESGDAGATEDTIPQEEQTADEAFFDSVGTFMSCMDAEAGGFIGLPESFTDPGSGDQTKPVNQPAYLEALQSCAARSDIINTMQAAEDSSRFTPEEIEERNRNFIAFRECLIGRGWSIPEPSPDENGLLFHSYVEAAQQWQAPAGQSILDSDDLGECAGEANPLGEDSLDLSGPDDEGGS